MSALTTIFKKEARELMTIGTFLPIIIMAILFATLGGAIGGMVEDIDHTPYLGYINADEGNFSAPIDAYINATSHVLYYATDSLQKDAALTYLQKNTNASALLVFPSNFSSDIEEGMPGTIYIYWIMTSTGMFDNIQSSAISSLLQGLSTEFSVRIITIATNGSLNTTFALNPIGTNQTTYFKGQELTGVSPGEILGVLSSQTTIIPIIMMMIIMTSGGMIISSMALEKENKTLETLLTLPIKRTAIIAGKIIASSLVGLIMAAIYMVGFSMYMDSFTAGASIDLAKYGFTITAPEMMLIGVAVFVTLIFALGLCMLLGTLAKNYKTAQTLNFPIVMLTIIPMFITMFTDINTLPLPLKILVLAIPFTYPMIAPQQMLLNNYVLVLGGIVYVGILAVILIAICVWVFKTDRIVAGGNGKLSRYFKQLQRTRRTK